MKLEDKLKLAEKLKIDALYSMGIDPYNEGEGKSQGARYHVTIKDGVINYKLIEDEN